MSQINNLYDLDFIYKNKKSEKIMHVLCIKTTLQNQYKKLNFDILEIITRNDFSQPLYCIFLKKKWIFSLVSKNNNSYKYAFIFHKNDIKLQEDKFIEYDKNDYIIKENQSLFPDNKIYKLSYSYEADSSNYLNHNNLFIIDPNSNLIEDEIAHMGYPLKKIKYYHTWYIKKPNQKFYIEEILPKEISDQIITEYNEELQYLFIQKQIDKIINNHFEKYIKNQSLLTIETLLQLDKQTNNNIFLKDINITGIIDSIQNYIYNNHYNNCSIIKLKVFTPTLPAYTIEVKENFTNNYLFSKKENKIYINHQTMRVYYTYTIYINDN